MDCIVNQMMTVAEYLGWDTNSLRPVRQMRAAQQSLRASVCVCVCCRIMKISCSFWRQKGRAFAFLEQCLFAFVVERVE